MMDEESKSIFYEAENPQASRELEELRRSGDYEPPFVVVRRRVIDDFNEGKMTIESSMRSMSRCARACLSTSRFSRRSA